MELLKKRILEEGEVIEPNILKVDRFLNHQIDVALYVEIGKELANRFKDKKIDKILTVEASGIALACFCSNALNQQPVVYAKKDDSKIISENTYSHPVHSFTKNKTSNIRVDKKFFSEDENILIIDDFLANGQASLGLASIVNQAKANVVGIGIVVEKGFQQGRSLLEKEGYKVESLAIIDHFENGKVIFR
ncbi:MAG: xanthine phosphoribosyltransferase [Erysipelotrichales bacterium]